MKPRRLPKWHPKVLASRVTQESRSFLVEEKFDTWLDLESYKTWANHCGAHYRWLTKWMRPFNRLVSPEAIVYTYLSGITPQMVKGFSVSPTLVARILYPNLSGRRRECPPNKKIWLATMKRCQEAASQSCRMQVAHMLAHVSDSLAIHTKPGYDKMQQKFNFLPPEVINMYFVVEEMMSVLERVRKLSEYSKTRQLTRRVKEKMKDVGNHMTLTRCECEVTLCGDVSYWKYEGRMWIVPKDLLLEIINKATEAFTYLLFSHFQDDLSMPQGHYYQAVNFLRWCYRQVIGHSRVGYPSFTFEQENKGFLVLKSVEGLGVAKMILEGDKELGWWNDTLLNNLWTALYQDGLVHQEQYQHSELHEILNSLTVPQIADLIGCVKLAGHPSIEVEKGLTKLYDRTHNAIEVNPRRVRESIGVLTRDICKQHYLKFKRYPNIDEIPQTQNDVMKQVLTTHIAPTDRLGRHVFHDIDAYTWSHVLFGKNAEFDPIDNQLILLKDTALGLERNKIWPILMEQVAENNSENVLRADNRRALLNFILTPHYSHDFTRFLQQYENDYPWQQTVLNYLVIKLTPKELELKAEGRMFGASPASFRNSRVVQEDNTMRLMESLIPDQLMTQDELSTIRKLYSFRYYSAFYPGHTIFQISFDFSKWNNNMRHASVDVPAAQILDRWFGKKLWGKTMAAYENALIYYMDRSRKRYWEGQLGGIEGLNQATWSFVFLGGVKNALERVGVVYQVTVKGDDVRAALAVPNETLQQRGPEMVRTQILNDLRELCVDMGWELNPNETFVSMSLIATSKQYQYKNCWLPAASKKMIKAMSLANLVFPTQEDIISSIFSCAHSACSQATVVMPAFMCASILGSMEIIRFLVQSTPFDRISPDQVAMLLMWPQVLGGPGCLPLQTFFVRGENDMLAVSISLMRYILLWGTDRQKMMVKSIGAIQFTEEPHFQLLLGDPYGLSLKIPERAASVLRRIMRAHLAKIAKNHHLRSLLNSQAQADKQRLMEVLASMRPYSAKVATVLWECSPFYIIEELLSKFMQSQTVFKFLTAGTGRYAGVRQAHKSLAKVLEAARNREAFWRTTIFFPDCSLDHLLGVPECVWMDPQICTTHIVHQIREKCWKTPIIGITYPSLVDQIMMWTIDDLHSKWPRFDMSYYYAEVFILADESKYETDFQSLHYASASSSVPWVGASTATRYHFVQGMTRITSVTLNKILKLLALRASGLYLGQSFVTLVDKLLDALTGVDLRFINLVAPELGAGHIPHRVACNSYSMITMPNFRTNLMQIIRVCPTGHIFLQGDRADRSLNYAAVHYMTIVLSLFPLQFGSHLPKGYPKVLYRTLHHDLQVGPHYAVCPWCLNIIDDEPINIQDATLLDLSHYRALPLVGTSEYDEKILIMNIHETMRGKGIEWAEDKKLDVTNNLVVTCATHIIIAQFGKEAQQAFMASRCAGFLHVPQGELREFMAAATSVSSVQTVSMNLLRAMGSVQLFVAVLSEAVTIISRSVLKVEHNAMQSLMMLQPFLNPLEPLFSSLRIAGLMDKLMQGANEWVTEHGDRMGRLEWLPSDTVDSHHFSLTFMRFAATILKPWLRGENTLHLIRVYVHFENQDTVEEEINRKILVAQRLLAVRMNSLCAGGAATHLFRKDVDAAWREYSHQNVNPLPYNAGEDLRFVRFLVNRYMHAIEGEYLWVRDVMAALYNIYTLPTWAIRSPEIDTILERLDRISEEFSILDYIGEERPVWNPIAFENSEYMGDLGKKMNPVYWRLWYQMMHMIEEHHLYELDAIGHTQQQQRDRATEAFTRFMTFRIAFMSKQDAERAIRAIVADPMNQILRDQLYLRLTPPQHHQFRSFEESCTYEDDQQHARTREYHAPLIVPADSGLAPAFAPTLGAFMFNNPENDPRPLFYDPREIARCGGHMNTAVSKYGPLLYSTGALDYVRQLGNRGVIACLADGIGGVATYCLNACPQAHVLYNSLIDTAEAENVPRDVGAYNAPAEVMSPWGTHHMDRCHYAGTYPGDLTIPETIRSLVNITMAYGILGVVTCDADIAWDLGLQHYMKLLWNVTQLCVNALSMEGTAIIKTFCIQDKPFRRWLHFCAAQFRHFHILRHGRSRSHSLEMFVVLGSCRMQMMSDELRESLWSGHSVCSSHVQAETYVQRLLGTITDIIRTFRLNGVINVVEPIIPIFALYYELRLPPLALIRQLVSSTAIDTTIDIHLCTAMHTVIQSLEEQLEFYQSTLHDRHITRQGNQRREPLPYIRAPQGSVVAVGRNLDAKTISRMLESAVMKHWLQTLLDSIDQVANPSPIFAVMTAVWDVIGRAAANGVAAHLDRRDDGSFSITVGTIVVEGSKACRRILHKSTRIFFAWMYMLFIWGTNRQEKHAMLQLWCSQAKTGECCRIEYDRLSPYYQLIRVDGPAPVLREPDLQLPDPVAPMAQAPYNYVLKMLAGIDDVLEGDPAGPNADDDHEWEEID